MKVATKDALVAFEVVANVQHLDGRLIVCPPHVALEDAHGLTAHETAKACSTPAWVLDISRFSPFSTTGWPT